MKRNNYIFKKTKNRLERIVAVRMSWCNQLEYEMKRAVRLEIASDNAGDSNNFYEPIKKNIKEMEYLKKCLAYDNSNEYFDLDPPV